ncbi:CRISPR-associated endonuclease Cas3'' [Streptomyces sp. MNU77]|uniref:CRISPR-associated endonuclease Cas3'' n=1 Tax=Streptomyces sp. MNU77 TaxID=1573406 RepID=UPI00211645D6|nr:CRISPR-associated endonuclease Cas3'' [Streptomyces sp. MNU77]
MATAILLGQRLCQWPILGCRLQGGWWFGGQVSERGLFAHSRSPRSGCRHRLEDHLRGSAALARAFAERFGAGDVAGYLALVHDVGKGCCAWQDRLIFHAEPTGKPVGIPHKEAGTVLAARTVGRQLAAVVQGHHGGLPNQTKIKDVLAELRGTGVDADRAREATEVVARVVPEILRESRIPPPAWLAGLGSQKRQVLALDVFTRMVFSCVVDADYLDTEAHFAGREPRTAARADMGMLLKRFEQRRLRLLARRTASPVDELRERVYAQALAAAAGAPGMYVLHVPTGGAKTIAAGGFALRHAVQHGLGRVVFAVPYISITQQNAEVYRGLLDPAPDSGEQPVVLEHHSSVELEEEDGAGAWARMAAENWDAPVVVTTTVQLFQSLFARKPSVMRKLHRLAGSVIVLDEVQALPDRLLIPILSVLRDLVEHFGASVVLMSATQPSFWSLAQLDGLPRRSMIEDVTGLFEELRRVEYDWRLGPDVTWESIAQEIASEGGEQVLTIVNTTRDSARLHRLLSSAEGEARVTVPVWHLSTRMTAEHRREVIKYVRGELAAGRPVHVVSTSLIEAGVDVDFPRVYRAWAPAEALQQAAGRCNRDGRLDRGRVVVFRPVDGGVPKDVSYTAALEATAEFFGPGDASAPDDLEALEWYYGKRWALQGTDGRLMGEGIQQLRRVWDFPAVAEAFQMVENRYAQSVVVIRAEKTDEERECIESDIALLRSSYPVGPEPLRRLQPHMATLPRHEVAKALQAGLAEPVIGDLVVWRGYYDPVRGLDADDPEDRGGYVL